MICENCGVRPASVRVFGQQGDQQSAAYLCTECARELGMIGTGSGGVDPFAVLRNLVQQQSQGSGGVFEMLSGEAQEAVMRAREASAGTTQTAAIGTDHLLAGVVTGDNVATEVLRRAARTSRGCGISSASSGGTRRSGLHIHPEREAGAAARLRRSAADGRCAGRDRASLARAARRGRRQRLPDIAAKRRERRRGAEA